MRIDAFFSAGEVEPPDVAGRVVVVVDVIRATSTMVVALANGARAIYPTLSTDEAIRLANSLGREDTLLCGERKGLKVDGFDLGNSPREFTPERVEGKRLVMSTTNGTRAFLATTGARRVLAASFLNLASVADAVVAGADGGEGSAEGGAGEGEAAGSRGAPAGADPPPVTIVCAGKENRFSLEDALCAGRLLAEMQGRVEGELVTNDAARAATALAERFPVDASVLLGTAAGRALADIGLEGDLAVCAEQDRHPIVPEMHDRQIRVPQGPR